MFGKKGQGTIEYLVIIAIVVVIALVVVGLLLQLSSPAKGTTENQSKNTWKTATPFAIVDWSRTSDGNLALILQNNSENQSINLKSITVGGVTAAQDKNNITQGSKVTAIVPVGACTTGVAYSFPKEGISIIFTTPTIGSDRTETAMADIVGTCN